MLQYKNFNCNNNELFEFCYFSMYSIIAYSADWGVVTNSTAATVQVSTAAGTREYTRLLQVLNLNTKLSTNMALRVRFLNIQAFLLLKDPKRIVET